MWISPSYLLTSVLGLTATFSGVFGQKSNKFSDTYFHNTKLNKVSHSQFEYYDCFEMRYQNWQKHDLSDELNEFLNFAQEVNCQTKYIESKRYDPTLKKSIECYFETRCVKKTPSNCQNKRYFWEQWLNTRIVQKYDVDCENDKKLFGIYFHCINFKDATEIKFDEKDFLMSALRPCLRVNHYHVVDLLKYLHSFDTQNCQASLSKNQGMISSSFIGDRKNHYLSKCYAKNENECKELYPQWKKHLDEVAQVESLENCGCYPELFSAELHCYKRESKEQESLHRENNKHNRQKVVKQIGPCIKMKPSYQHVDLYQYIKDVWSDDCNIIKAQHKDFSKCTMIGVECFVSDIPECTEQTFLIEWDLKEISELSDPRPLTPEQCCKKGLDNISIRVACFLDPPEQQTTITPITVDAQKLEL